jgi:hypothetical protein
MPRFIEMTLVFLLEISSDAMQSNNALVFTNVQFDSPMNTMKDIDDNIRRINSL